jgi:lipopolysaccharide transport system ATP-binding protein
MPDTIIEVQNLSKLYELGTIGGRTLRESLERRWYRMRGKEHLLRKIGAKHQTIGPDHPQAGPRPNTMWALKDVSFSVKEGEVLGIIGRNGAGKSTLLKLLTRITEPTLGRALVYGRVASLLEVGTGFHPELTGRENIYLNGAILGMKRVEIDLKFDEIVEFSGIAQYLDTPVKRYSSGMYVRLAFAVAAHLDPEILLVDEVLAVGDAEFQKKCLGKMEDVAKGGRTVLFVSHNMGAVNRLCRRAAVLDHGRIVLEAPATEATARYLQSDTGTMAERRWRDVDFAPGDDVARLKAVRVLNLQGVVSDTIEIREPMSIEIEYLQLENAHRPTAVVHVVNDQGTTLFATNDWENKAWHNTLRSQGLVRARCVIPGNFLAEGHFFVLVAVVTYDHPAIHHVVERDVVSFQVVDHSEGDGARGPYEGLWPGVVRPRFEWEVTHTPQTTSRPSVASPQEVP